MIWIIVSTLILNIFSIFNLFGIDHKIALTQLIFLLIGVVIFVLIKRIGIDYFKNNINSLYWIFILLFVLLFFIGDNIRGSVRWINLYIFNFQPSEFFKLIFIFFITKLFLAADFDIEKKTYFFKSLIYVFIPFILVYFEPDFGNALSYAFIYLVMLIYSTIPKKYLLITILMGVLTLPIVWNIMRDYQRQRLISFIKPNVNQLTTNYNSYQAIITVGSGKFFGRGLGFGTQSKLQFLPENHTDFAYSSLVEQFGFFGGSIVISLYFIIFFILIKKIIYFYKNESIDNKFYFYYLVGFFAYLFFQVFINIGMNLGVVPVTGLSLPMISYGGSSLVTYFIGISLLPLDKV